jgi:GNAT superfamily N-acetyltransferase
MPATFRPYAPHSDWARIRDFLVDTFALYQRPFNWMIDRWNFCRHFVLPLHTFCNVRDFGVPTRTAPPVRDELPGWERTIGVWENAAGEIVGVAHSENEEPGEAWIEIHPDYTDLCDEMVTYAEAHLADRADGAAFVRLYVNAGSALEQVAQARGYRQLQGQGMNHLEHRIGDVPVSPLPAGYVIRSVTDEDDVEQRRMVRAFSFGGYCPPSDWPPASAMRALQQAPDYRPELDLFVVAPNGEYASFCTIWLDERNRYANFEPVGTHADYQRLGLGRALLTEGFRRMARYGATRSFMDSGNPFYRKVGFQPTPWTYYPWIKYFPA